MSRSATHLQQPCLTIFSPVFVYLCSGVEGKTSHAGVNPADIRCLVRAVGAKQKISAMISSKDYRRFMQSYGNILKVSLDSLKKKEKKKDIAKGGAKSVRKGSAKS